MGGGSSGRSCGAIASIFAAHPLAVTACPGAAVGLIAAARTLAPTCLRLGGAAIGLAAGGLGAAAVQSHDVTAGPLAANSNRGLADHASTPRAPHALWGRETRQAVVKRTKDMEFRSSSPLRPRQSASRCASLERAARHVAA